MFWCFNSCLILDQSFLLGRYTSTTIVLSPLCPSRMFWWFYVMQELVLFEIYPVIQGIMFCLDRAGVWTAITKCVPVPPLVLPTRLSPPYPASAALPALDVSNIWKQIKVYRCAKFHALVHLNCWAIGDFIVNRTLYGIVLYEIMRFEFSDALEIHQYFILSVVGYNCSRTDIGQVLRTKPSDACFKCECRVSRAFSHCKNVVHRFTKKYM